MLVCGLFVSEVFMSGSLNQFIIKTQIHPGTPMVCCLVVCEGSGFVLDYLLENGQVRHVVSRLGSSTLTCLLSSCFKAQMFSRLCIQ